MADPFAFDPVAVGRAECDAWVAYYRHEWRRLLVDFVTLVRSGFGMGWPSTLAGAWWVLRANQAWAPVPDNDPDGARRFMRRFYALVVRSGRFDLDPVKAATLEVRWWRDHRNHQHSDSLSDEELVSSLNDLYAYVYGCEPAATRRASELRVEAMDLSDRWVAAGADRGDPLLVQERLALIASYTALRDAVDRRARA
jgi:hypothetical protein